MSNNFASPIQFTSASVFLVMRLVFLVAVFSLLQCANGWPVAVARTRLLVSRDEHSYSNSTANATTVDADPSWVAAPKVRGTWQLIVGCLTTLSLCAWTAYHPNVCHESGMAKKLWRRFTWMMAAIVGPEAVLYCAWEQRWTACELRKKVNRLGGRAIDGFEPLPRKEDEYILTRCSSAPTFSSQSSTLHDDNCSVYSSRSDAVALQPSPSKVDCGARSPFMRFSFEELAIEKPHHDGSSQQPPQDKSSPLFTPWTLQQTFFAVCGGLAVSTGSFWHSPTMTLTPRGVLELTRAGLLPDVTDEEVTEKSKANTAAKIMVCIQASWFLVQAIARLAQKLPLTLLEVHVLAHVLCALAMYFCWVDKPYDAEMPIVIEDEKIKDMVALFVLDGARRNGLRSDEIDLHDRMLRPISMAEIQERHMPRRWVRDPSIKAPRFMFKLELPDDDDSKTEETIEEFIQVEREPPTPEQVSRMQEHHKRANRGLDYLRNRYFQVVACRGDSEMPREPRLQFRQRGRGRRYVVDQRSNRLIEGKIEIDDSTTIRSILTFGVISAGYGAVHLCAWNEHFPSTVECWMWRVAALCMVSFPFAGAALFRGIYLWSKILPQKDRWNRARWQYVSLKIALGVVAFVVLGPIFLVTFAAMAGWCYGRLFMLIEAAFMSLRSPPLNTYRIPEWSAYWPHAG